MSFTSWSPIPFTSWSYLSSLHHRHAPMRKQIKGSKKTNKSKRKQQKNHNRKISLPLFLTCFFNTTAFILIAMEASLCHIVYTSLSHHFYWQICYSESLVWFKTSDFWYTIITRSSPELLWVILWVIGYHESWRAFRHCSTGLAPSAAPAGPRC